MQTTYTTNKYSDDKGQRKKEEKQIGGNIFGYFVFTCFVVMHTFN